MGVIRTELIDKTRLFCALRRPLIQKRIQSFRVRPSGNTFERHAIPRTFFLALVRVPLFDGSFGLVFGNPQPTEDTFYRLSLRLCRRRLARGYPDSFLCLLNRFPLFGGRVEELKLLQLSVVGFNCLVYFELCKFALRVAGRFVLKFCNLSG